MKTTISFSGELGTLTYSFPHNLGYKPNYKQATPVSDDAGGNDQNGLRGGSYWVDADDTTASIVYYAQPPIGTDNLTFSVELLVITTFDANQNPRCDANHNC